MITVYTLNPNMNQTELSYCISYVNNLGFTFENNATAEDYCLGTAKSNGHTFQAAIDNNYSSNNLSNLDDLVEHNVLFGESGLALGGYNYNCGQKISIPNKTGLTIYTYNINRTSQDVNDCATYLANYYFDSSNGENATDFCSGTGTSYGSTLLEKIEAGNFSLEEIRYLISHNIVTVQKTGNYKVLVLYDMNVYEKEITEIKLNKDLKIISRDSFINIIESDISNITIPGNVRFIGQRAFAPINHVNSNPDISLNILGKPFMGSYSLDYSLNITYGGTCQELYNNSAWYTTRSTVIYGIWDQEYYIKTTDTDTCVVYGDTD